MYYYTNEIRLELPEIKQDRTVNVLTLTDPSRGIPMQLVVSRDQLLGGEDLDKCFERQLGILRRQTQALKINSQQSLKIGESAIPAKEVESSFSQGGKSFHQLQAMWVVEAPMLLVLTLSSQLPINNELREFWRQMLTKLALRA